MKKLIILSCMMLQALPTLLAQNYSDSSNVELEGLNRSEIRRIFLGMEETSETYKLALSSQIANGQSIRSLSLAGLFVVGGFYGLIEADKRKFGFERMGIGLLTITSFGISIPLLIRGVNKNKDSRNDLDEALNTYHKK